MFAELMTYPLDLPDIIDITDLELIPKTCQFLNSFIKCFFLNCCIWVCHHKKTLVQSLIFTKMSEVKFLYIVILIMKYFDNI